MALSLHHGRRVLLAHAGGFADGVAVEVCWGGNHSASVTISLNGVVLVHRDSMCAAIKVCHSTPFIYGH